MRRHYPIFTEYASLIIFLCGVAFSTNGASTTPAKTLIDYFQPAPIYNHLSSDVWGAAGVIPRDVSNGLEDSTMKQWQYWDGKIIKGPDGKYHMFASRWRKARA